MGPEAPFTGEREATMVHLSQSLATQTDHSARFPLPHCQSGPNAAGGAVIFSMSVYGGCVVQITGLLSAGRAHAVECRVKGRTTVEQKSDFKFLT